MRHEVSWLEGVVAKDEGKDEMLQYPGNVWKVQFSYLCSLHLVTEVERKDESEWHYYHGVKVEKSFESVTSEKGVCVILGSKKCKSIS